LTARADEIYVRINQLGYSPNDTKIAIAFSATDLPAEFTLNDGENVVYQGNTTPVTDTQWGRFKHHAELNFSTVHVAGIYALRIGGAESIPVRIKRSPYDTLPSDLLDFMHEQRCGHNPWLGADCHTRDGRTAYGPLPAGTQIDVSGGWHDAADLLKYLMTSEDATTEMLLAYLVSPNEKRDRDVLVEARWARRVSGPSRLSRRRARLFFQRANPRWHRFGYFNVHPLAKRSIPITARRLIRGTHCVLKCFSP
jgi:hypothetical protein